MMWILVNESRQVYLYSKRRLNVLNLSTLIISGIWCKRPSLWGWGRGGGQQELAWCQFASVLGFSLRVWRCVKVSRHSQWQRTAWRLSNSISRTLQWPLDSFKWSFAVLSLCTQKLSYHDGANICHHFIIFFAQLKQSVTNDISLW